MLREFQFPLIAGLALRPETALVTGQVCDGFRYPDIPALLDASHTDYMAQDNKAVEFGCLYPGLTAVNCFLLAEAHDTLGFMSFDPTFQNTLHLLRRCGGAVGAVLVKYPFLRPGESAEVAGYRLCPVSGDWHRAADLYRAWCDGWIEIPEKPESVRRMNGWHRLILRHQYGRQLFHYRDLPDILKSGLAAGIDTLFLFGWHAGGHDSCYPEYDFAEDEGGHDELKKQIAAFQAGGGHVILYYNGQLIDTATRFYETAGKRVSVKLPSGREHMEVYPFGGDGTALRQFGSKVFVTASRQRRMARNSQGTGRQSDGTRLLRRVLRPARLPVGAVLRPGARPPGAVHDRRCRQGGDGEAAARICQKPQSGDEFRDRMVQ